jgi:hypothetical protein
MVRKNYVAPSLNEARTKLRAGLLAGSATSATTKPSPANPGETPVITNPDDDGAKIRTSLD